MEKFYAWMMKPISSEDVEVWFNANGMVPEKRELLQILHIVYII